MSPENDQTPQISAGEITVREPAEASQLVSSAAMHEAQAGGTATAVARAPEVAEIPEAAVNSVASEPESAGPMKEVRLPRDPRLLVGMSQGARKRAAALSHSSRS